MEEFRSTEQLLMLHINRRGTHHSIAFGQTVIMGPGAMNGGGVVDKNKLASRKMNKYKERLTL